MALGYMPTFFHSQFFITPEYPTHDFSGQVIIVTGANTGLGLEAARHIARLNAQKVILAVRTTSKGETARADIEESTGRTGVVDVWSLDMLSFDSVKTFAKKVQQLPRVDAVIENAGIFTRDFKFAEGHERTIVTNVISTFLLALLLLPKLRESATKSRTTPRLSIVTSEVHYFTQLPEKSSPSIFDRLKDEQTADMNNRYFVSKAVQLLYFRELAMAVNESLQQRVTLNVLNPGLCTSNIMATATDASVPFVKRILQRFVARSTEVGGRTLVAAACAPPETHGEYMSDGVIAPVANWVKSDEGRATGKRVWNELNAILEDIQPGIMKSI